MPPEIRSCSTDEPATLELPDERAEELVPTARRRRLEVVEEREVGAVAPRSVRRVEPPCACRRRRARPARRADRGSARASTGRHASLDDARCRHSVAMRRARDRRLPLRTRLDLLAADTRSADGRARELVRGALRRSDTSISRRRRLRDRPCVLRRSRSRRRPTRPTTTARSCSTSAPTRATSAPTRSRTALSRGRRVRARVGEPRSARAHGQSYRRRRRVDDSPGSGRRDAPGAPDLHVMDGSWGHALEPPDAVRGARGRDRASGGRRAREHASRGSRAHSAGRRLVVKINIEGAECSAILGTSTERVGGTSSEVFVETHPWASCGADEIAAQLELAGLSRVASAHPAVVRMRREEPPRSGRRSDPT